MNKLPIEIYENTIMTRLSEKSKLAGGDGKVDKQFCSFISVDRNYSITIHIFPYGAKIIVIGNDGILQNRESITSEFLQANKTRIMEEIGLITKDKNVDVEDCQQGSLF